MCIRDRCLHWRCAGAGAARQHRGRGAPRYLPGQSPFRPSRCPNAYWHWHTQGDTYIAYPAHS
eukprot:784439-Rhodomonas_salina.1